jgi:hypothetical protein
MSAPRGAVLLEVRPDSAEHIEVPEDGARLEAVDLLDRLRLAYEERVDRYHHELAVTATADASSRSSRYPEVTVTLDIEETVPIDSELFERLFDIYVYHGWDGVRRVEESLAAVAPDTPSAGFSDSAWGPAWGFFLFTRNLLARLVREELIELERRAAERVGTHMSVVAAAVSEAVRSKYKITREKRAVEHADEKGRRFKTWEYAYSWGEPEESKALFAALTQAVEQRIALDRTLREIGLARRDVGRVRGYQQRREQRNPGNRDPGLERELQLKDEQLAEVERRANELYLGMQKLIALNSPFGLLALEGLTAGFTQERMEELLGATLWELYARLDRLGAGIDPLASHVSASLSGVGPEEFDAWPDLQRGQVPAAGPEAAVVEAAVAGLGEHPGWFPLLHETTLHGLVESGEIDRDSFAFVVFTHYVVALGERLEAERRAEEAAQAFWDAFAKFAAAASLILLLTPASALGAVLRAGVAIADVIQLAHSVDSVVQQLDRLEQLRDEQLLHPDALALEGLGRLGELGAFRDELLSSVTQQILLELAQTALGGRWGPVKKLLIMRGYYEDVDVLLDGG